MCYILLVSLSPKISLRSSLRPAVFQLQAILRQVHWMTPKWPWTLQHLVYTRSLISVTNIYESQISVLFCSTSNRFLSYRPFWDKVTEWPQNDLEHCEVKSPICVTSAPESQISLRFALQPIVAELQAILNTKMTQNDLKPTRSNVPHMLVPTSPKFHCFALPPAVL